MNGVITGALSAALVIVLAWGGPALDDHSAERDQARATEDAQRAAAARARFERAAQAVCGSQAAWREVGNGLVQCFDKRARPTVRRSTGGTEQ